MIPTPISNFAPLSYFNYGLYSNKQDNETLTNFGTTAACELPAQDTSTASTISVPSDTHSDDSRRTIKTRVLPVRREKYLFATSLKRPRSLDSEREGHELAVKRAVEEVVPVPQHADAPMDCDPFASNVVSMSSSCKKEKVETSTVGEEHSKAVIEPTGTSPAESESPRNQRCQRVRRLPARYRDDYVCALNDVDTGDEVMAYFRTPRYIFVFEDEFVLELETRL
ncbi:hypothetical protein OESDEN_15491 [Oesophagostomum dentatum]|uniref:Uncharacterized protein n=1 Tax=Oesophagostomum dentatum TaxID=61180 RepID=A0A0B1SNL8_OESDE|nr:hypothetical protein OESDEN_15491 [Oesophagostomum dentatum]